jgi:hypothetical protein
MNPRKLSSFLLLGAATAALLPAQQQLHAAPRAELVAPIRDQGVRDDGTAAGAWAAGGAFKCSLHDGAFTLVPYLGREAPHNLPWTWRTIAATLGEADLRGGAAPLPQHGDRRFAAAAGLVTERWDVAAEHVEQSFVIAARPAAGELVVRGAISGPWRAEPRGPRHAPLLFRATDGRAELRYGEAVAIDANGSRWPVPTAFDGTHVSLHVAASTVAAAAFPLVLDPLLTVYVIDSGTFANGHGILDSSIDHVDATDDMSVVRAEVRWASNVDGDLLVWKMRDDFAVGQLVHSDLDPAVQAFDASVAAVGNNRSYVVAWSRGTSASTSGIFWFPLDADSYGPPVVRTLVRPSGTTERSPRVAGRRGQVAGAPAHALLVRLRETSAGTARTELWGTLLDVAAATHGPTVQIANGGTASNAIDNAEPWINRDAANTWSHWLVAWQTWSDADGRWTVRARRVSHDGVLANGVFVPDMPQGGPWHAMQPRVEGFGNRFLFAFAVAPTSSFPGKLSTFEGQGVYVQRFGWSGLTASVEHPLAYLAASFSRDLEIGGLAGDSRSQSHWAISYGRHGFAPTIAQLGYRGRIVRSATLPGPGASAGSVAFRAASIAFDRTAEQYRVHYGVRTSNAGVNGYHAYAGRYEYPALATPAIYGSSCGAGHIGYLAKFRIGSDLTGVGLIGTTPNLPAIAALSTQPGSLPLQPFGLGNCSLLVDPAAPAWLGTMLGITDSGGDYRFELPLPENLAPLDLYAQCFTLQPTGVLAATVGMRCELR